MREVGAPKLRIAIPCLCAQGEVHVPGAAAEIQNAGVRPVKNLRERARGAAPPQAVDVERQKVVEQIVAGSDRGKHLADGARRCVGIACAFGGGADYEFASSGHDCRGWNWRLLMAD